VDGGRDVAELRGEGVVDRRRVEGPARFGVRLVGEVDALDEVERGLRVRAVPGVELVVERGRVQRVDPHHPDAEVGHLDEPATVVLGPEDVELPRLAGGHAAAQVHPRKERLVTRRRVEAEAVGVRLGEDADLPRPDGGRGPVTRPGVLLTAGARREAAHEQHPDQHAARTVPSRRRARA
jgi:hypothetical protein